MVRAQRMLEVYVAPGCLGCETAHRLAAMVRRLAPPELEVRLIDLSDPDAVRPLAVFAVPTYLLDGRVISLGNPEEAWLLAQIGVRTGPVRPAPGADR
ncbi:MAG: thioredoxin family protein [Chloroflexota bacterium]|nr:thioredoxin family protein [Chloroflexota bacterium]